jgi:hypothetical protein
MVVAPPTLIAKDATRAFSVVMSATGHTRTLRRVDPMSALPPKADIERGKVWRCKEKNSRLTASVTEAEEA